MRAKYFRMYTTRGQQPSARRDAECGDAGVGGGAVKLLHVLGGSMTLATVGSSDIGNATNPAVSVLHE